MLYTSLLFVLTYSYIYRYIDIPKYTSVFIVTIWGTKAFLNKVDVLISLYTLIVYQSQLF